MQELGTWIFRVSLDWNGLSLSFMASAELIDFSFVG